MTRVTVCILILLVQLRVAWAETPVSGRIDTDTVWTVDGSPYVLDDDIEVAGGATLTIEAGVTVQGRAGTKLIVGGVNTGDSGTLQVLGISGQTIFFDSRVRDEPWGGIEFRETTIEPQFDPGGEFVSGSILRSCRIDRANEPVVMRGAVAYLDSTTIAGPAVPLGSAVRVELRDVATPKSLRADGLEVFESSGFGLVIEGGTGHQLVECSFRYNYQGANIVALSLDDTETIRIDRCWFLFNGVDGSTLDEGFGLQLTTSGDIVVSDSVFVGNIAASRGGAISGGTAGSLTISRCEFSENHAGRSGGAVAMTGRVTVIEDSVFAENTADQAAAGYLGFAGAGATRLLRRNIFRENRAVQGGAMSLFFGSVDVEDCDFIGNTSVTDAGAVRFFSEGGDVRFADNRFSANVTGGAGGAIGVIDVRSAADVSFERNSFRDNIARLGGAVYTNELVDDPSTFRFAGSDGSTNTFSNNTAELGDDIYHAGPADIDATGVCWGTTVPVAIAARIYDGTDEPGLGIVRFDPVAADCDVCRADLDGDGALTVFDFLAFSGLFGLGDPQADFDGDGRLTLFDFLAFQAEFDAGCP
ncbi:MAG: right-handed parallel beta-helix repeat-containing protein [Phycisphaerales bacterium]